MLLSLSDRPRGLDSDTEEMFKVRYHTASNGSFQTPSTSNY